MAVLATVCLKAALVPGCWSVNIPGVSCKLNVRRWAEGGFCETGSMPTFIFLPPNQAQRGVLLVLNIQRNHAALECLTQCSSHSMGAWEGLTYRADLYFALIATGVARRFDYTKLPWQEHKMICLAHLPDLA